jgi:hypothetical protein
MRNSCIIFLLIFVGINGYSQDQVTEIKNSFNLKIGLENRITPIILKHDNSLLHTVRVYPYGDDQLTGRALNAGIFYLLKKSKIAFALSNSIRYDHLYYKADLNSPVLEEKKGVISDVHIDISKYFPIRKNHLQIGIGYSWMNYGTDYVYHENLTSSSGNTIMESKGDFRFNAFNLTLGYQVNQFSFELINRFMLNYQYMGLGNLMLPSLRVAYSLKYSRRQII